jgi:hypothetical protein
LNRQRAAVYAIASVAVAIVTLAFLGFSIGLPSAAQTSGSIGGDGDPLSGLTAQVAAAQEQAAREVEAQRAAAQRAVEEEVAQLRADAEAALAVEVSAQRDAAQQALDGQIAAERSFAIAALQAQLDAMASDVSGLTMFAAAFQPSSEDIREAEKKLAECARKSDPKKRAKCEREALEELQEHHDDDEHEDDDDD